MKKRMKSSIEHVYIKLKHLEGSGWPAQVTTIRRTSWKVSLKHGFVVRIDRTKSVILLLGLWLRSSRAKYWEEA